MTDYLDVRVRGRSESVYTEASTAVASLPSSPLPISKPPPSPLLGALVAPKLLSNTILKSHGRPPWYCLNLQPKHREFLNVFVQVWRGWPADFACFCHWDSWYVDGLSVATIVITPTFQTSFFFRRLFQRKGSPTFATHFPPLILPCRIDPRRTSDRAFPRLNTHGCYHVTGSDLSAFGARR